ncbi:autotransporter domain-containing protein [Chelativorans sp. J32]|uniref:autotransporter domain-containing protein n=1 Tax=Chelativorans sp. J32 TaxID=935840 RepID=UPI0009FFA4B9|nr:autotransporter domain-containing protein [Chelativorans sp. J32]
MINGSYGPPAYPPQSLQIGGRTIANVHYRVMPHPITAFGFEESAEAVEAAADADVVLVFAAGNEYDEQPNQAANPTGPGFLPLITAGNLRSNVFQIITAGKYYDPDSYVYANPTDPKYDDLDYSHLGGSLIAVVATNREGAIASYSNHCGLAWQWCLAAPGGDDPKPGQTEEYSEIYSTLPDGKYGLEVGTSMAAPVVSGGAAVLRQAFPYMTARQINEIILTTARPIGPREIYGRGMFDLGRAILGPKYFGDPLFGMVFDVDTKGHDTMWLGDIEGPGSLIKRGEGHLLLGGDNSYEGGTQVLGGALVLAGTLRSDVMVGEDATLYAADGTIIANLEIWGVLSPGTAGNVGELEVDGDTILTGTSTYEVDVAADKADLLDVDNPGSIRLEGGALAVKLEGGLAPLSPLDIIVAERGINGSFGSFTTNSMSAFLNPLLYYGTNAVTLSFVPNGRTFASAAYTPNQSSVANALDGAPYSTPWKHVAQQSLDGARRALDQLSGEIYASQKPAIVEDSRYIRDAANDRLRAALSGARTLSMPILAYSPDGAEALPEDSERFTVWSAAFGGWGSFDGNGNAAGLDLDNGGFLIGGDLPVGGLRIGALTGMGWSNYSVDERSSTTDLKAYHLGLYGGGRWNAFGVRSGLAYSWLDLTTMRMIKFPGIAEQLNADYHGSLFQTFGEISWEVDKNAFRFEPFANLAYVNLRTGSLDENGTVGLSSGKDRFSKTLSTAGIRASMKLKSLPVPVKLSATAGWRHAFGDTKPTSDLAFEGVPSFTTAGLPLAKNEAMVGLGLDLELAKNATMSLSYSGSFNGDTRTNTFDARFRMRF